jgi:flagellar biosynthetic protein FliR
MDPAQLLLTVGLVTTRILGVIAIMPVFGMDGTSTIPKVLLGVGLAILIAPNLSVDLPAPTMAAFIVGISTEFLLGILLGGVVRILFDALALAGQLVGTQTGQAAALQFDPTLNIAQGPLGRLATLLAAAVFVGNDLHLELFIAVGESFNIVAPGGATNVLGASAHWIELSDVMIQTGFRLAVPVIVLVFLNNLFIASVMRLAPQMNIFFSLGFILTIFGGELVYLLTLPHMLNEHQNALREAMKSLWPVLETAGGG